MRFAMKITKQNGKSCAVYQNPFHFRIIKSFSMTIIPLNIMNNKVIIVTGCSRGIGQAISRMLIDQGNIVACFSRSYPTWIDDYSESKVFWQQGDIEDFSKVKLFVRQVYKQFGRIDGLVNNAGINYDGILTTMSEETIHKILHVNVEAVLFLTQQVAKYMLVKNGGSIVNIGSIVGGARGYKGAVVYGSSKSAIIGMTKCLARELGEKIIRVNAVLPGFVTTNMTSNMAEDKKAQTLRRIPLKRFASPSEIASVVKFLLSDESSYVTGHCLVVDGGSSC